MTTLMARAEYVPILRRVNEQCTPTEQEWIIRIILKGDCNSCGPDTRSEDLYPGEGCILVLPSRGGNTVQRLF